MKDDPQAAAFEAAMRQFRADFLASLPGRLEDARLRLQACLAQPQDDAGLRELHLVVHKLVGAAGTFGLPALGAAAAAAEDALLALAERPQRGKADFAPLVDGLASVERIAGDAA